MAISIAETCSCWCS